MSETLFKDEYLMDIRAVEGSRHFYSVICGQRTTTNFGWCFSILSPKLDHSNFVEDAERTDIAMIKTIERAEEVKLRHAVERISERQVMGMSGEQLAHFFMNQLAEYIPRTSQERILKMQIWPIEPDMPTERVFTMIRRYGGGQKTTALFEAARDFVYEITETGLPVFLEGVVKITHIDSGKSLELSERAWASADGNASLAFARAAAARL